MVLNALVVEWTWTWLDDSCLALGLAPKKMMLGRQFTILLTLGVTVHMAVGALTGKETTVEQAFPQLEDLNKPNPHMMQAVGGQNFTRCCLKAVRATYDIVDGKLGFSTNPATRFLGQTPQELSELDFPCGAKYTGNDRGAPLVSVPYHWCAENCPGWQQSVNGDLNQWIIPFVGFILPAAVFCLSIPRRRIFSTPDNLFPNHIDKLENRWVAFVRALLKTLGITIAARTQHHDESGLKEATSGPDTSAITQDDGKESRTELGLAAVIHLLWWFGYALIVGVEMSIRASIAASIAFLNTILWVAMVFTAAAPMMLSGLYEAMVDRNVLDAIMKNRKWNRIRRQTHIEVADIKREVHLLYAILVGNISLPSKDPLPIPDQPTAWSDVERLVDTLDSDPAAPAGQKPNETIRQINKPAGDASRLRLHTMLQCQVSFGATVGAPIVFYLGAFLVSVFSSLLEIGNNDTAHTIAFGEWWMTIPHVAIVAGCLLAGNNPNTLEAIMSGFPHPSERPDHNTLNDKFTGLVKKLVEYFSPVYDSIYQPVWMWERGRNKRLWVQEVQIYHNQIRDGLKSAAAEETKNGLTTTTSAKPAQKGVWEFVKKKLKKRLERLNSKYVANEDDDAKALSDDIPDIDVEDWFYLVVNVVVLLLIPFVLALLTSYHTPLVGLSCRSFTFTLYFLFQFWLGVLWFWDFNHDKHVKLLFRYRGYALPTPFTLLVTFGLLGSGFTAMVGTFLQILGVYRNCLCKLPIQYWSAPTDVRVILSTNMDESITYARQYWLSTGIASIVLLIVVCYLGWWYQRHWRMRFEKVVKEVLPEPRTDEVKQVVTPVEPAEAKTETTPKPAAVVGEDEITPVKQE